MGTPHYVNHPPAVLYSPASLVLPVLPVLAGELTSASDHAALLPPPVAAPEEAVQAGDIARPHQEATTSPRCREKGCIFPALAGVLGKCIHHTREELEPAMYLSKQPSRAALEHGKFFYLCEEKMFGSREADRRRFKAEREAFFAT